MRIKVKNIHHISHKRGGLDFKPRTVTSIDTETTGTDTWGPRPIFLGGIKYLVRDEIFMLAMCDDRGHTWCCDWPVDPFTRKATPNQEDIDFLIWVLSIPNIEIVFHNSKFDYRMIDNLSKEAGKLILEIAKRNGLHDTLYMGRTFYTLELTYGLKPLSKKYVGIDDIDEKDLQTAVVNARRKLTSFNSQLKAKFASSKTTPRYMLKGDDAKEDYWLPKYFDPTNTLCEKYCRQDVFRTIALYFFYKEKIDADPALKATYEFEMFKLWHVVNDMEARAILVHPERVNEESQRCSEAITVHLAAMNKIIEEKGLLPFPPEKMRPKSPRCKTWKIPEFNPSSSQQILRLLYAPYHLGGLGLETDRRSKIKFDPKSGEYKGGTVTADKDALKKLIYEPFVKELIGYRAAALTKSLFFDKFQVIMRPDPLDKSGNMQMVVFPSIQQAGTKAGRLSYMTPNMQQCGAGGKKGLGGNPYSSQKVFGPRPGYVWLGFDYSQQEARLFAYLAQVSIMLKAIETGEDIFKAMSNKAWGGKGNPQSIKAGILAMDLFRESSNGKVKLLKADAGWGYKEEFTLKPDDKRVVEVVDWWLEQWDYDIVAAEASLDKEASRQRCKHITYAKIFGGGPGSFTHLLLCSLEEAKIFDAEYNASMPEMKRYMKELQQQAQKDGFIYNMYGRKLRVERDFAYRAVSYKIQGTAAEQMKNSLVKVDKFNKDIAADAHIILSIHDEMKIEIRERDLNTAYIRGVASRMENTDGNIGIYIPTECTIAREYWSIGEEKIDIWGKGYVRQ